MGIWLAGGMKKLSGIKSWWRLHNFVNMLKPTTLNPSKGWILWYVNCHLSKKGNMFVYLCYRPEFTFIYKPGPKQEFDEREPPRDHYKGIETVTPTRDKPLAVLRQVKTPLVSTLQNHRNVFHSIRTTHLYYRGRQFPPPPAVLEDPAQMAVVKEVSPTPPHFIHYHDWSPFWADTQRPPWKGKRFCHKLSDPITWAQG